MNVHSPLKTQRKTAPIPHREHLCGKTRGWCSHYTGTTQQHRHLSPSSPHLKGRVISALAGPPAAVSMFPLTCWWWNSWPALFSFAPSPQSPLSKEERNICSRQGVKDAGAAGFRDEVAHPLYVLQKAAEVLTGNEWLVQIVLISKYQSRTQAKMPYLLPAVFEMKIWEMCSLLFT